MPYMWEFIQESKTANPSWRWKKHALDGSTHESGPPFAAYGEATKDEVLHGFRPSRQPWIVITPTTVTHFTKDHMPITEARTTYNDRPGTPQGSGGREDTH
jgi:hypothetical protein